MKPKKQALWLGIALLAMTGMFTILAFFSLTLRPIPTAIEKWHTELDISQLSTGELKVYDTAARRVWVYRRTPEQIEWLAADTYRKAAGHESSQADGALLDSKLRSVKPEFFVFTTQQHNKRTYLQERESGYECKDVRYLAGQHKIGDRILNGMIVCEDGPSYLPGPPKPGYDVAGIATQPSVEPLMLPHYVFNRQGNIVVGPKP